MVSIRHSIIRVAKIKIAKSENISRLNAVFLTRNMKLKRISSSMSKKIKTIPTMKNEIENERRVLWLFSIPHSKGSAFTGFRVFTARVKLRRSRILIRTALTTHSVRIPNTIERRGTLT